MNKVILAAAAVGGCSLALTSDLSAQSASGPGARYSHSMAYDSARQVVVLFGGNRNASWPSGALSDTWEWDGNTWTQRQPANSPGPRGHGVMVYDSVRGVCVYYGG